MLAFFGFIAFIFLFVQVRSLSYKVSDLEKKVATQHAHEVQPGATKPVATATATTTAVNGHIDTSPQIASHVPASSTPLGTTPVHVETEVQSAMHSEAKVAVQPKVQPLVQSQNTQTDEHTEFALGSKVLTGVGVLAVLLGVIFFLRYAFENGLISETMRVVLGLLGGLVLVVIGHLLKNKYAAYGSKLVGGGIGVLYVTVFAATWFYGLWSIGMAFFGFIVITIVGVSLALLYNSAALAGFSFAGGYIAALMFPEVTSPHGHFLFLTLLNIAILLIARFRAWPKLVLLGLGMTVLLSLRWTASSYAGDTMIALSYAYTALQFFIFFCTSFINFLVRDRDYKGIDAFLVYSLPFAYLFVVAPLIETKYQFAGVTVALGGFYMLASLLLRVIFTDKPAVKIGSNIMLVLGSVFVALATSIYYEGATLLTMLAVESIVLISAGTIIRAKATRIFGAILGLITVFFTVIASTELDHSNPIFNERLMIFIFSTALCAVMWAVYQCYLEPRKNNLEYNPSGATVIAQNEVETFRPLAAIGVALLPFMWIHLEMEHLFATQPEYVMPIIWSLFALVLTAISFWGRTLTFRVIGYIMIFMGTVMAIATHWTLLHRSYTPLFNIRTLTVAIVGSVIGLIIVMMRKNKEQLTQSPREVFIVAHIVLHALIIWVGSVEVLDYFNNKIQMIRMDSSVATSGTAGDISGFENTKRLVLSLWWLVYAIAGLAYGIVEKSVFVRRIAIAMLGLTIYKIFIYDTANLNDIYRFISFITLGIILLATGFVYYRFKDRIIGLVK